MHDDGRNPCTNGACAHQRRAATMREKWGLTAMQHDEVEQQLGRLENITMAEAVPQPPHDAATCDAALEWRDRGRHANAWGARGGDGSPVCPCMLNAGTCTREGNAHPIADAERGTMMAQAAISDMPNGAEDITCSCRRSFSTQLGCDCIKQMPQGTKRTS